MCRVMRVNLRPGVGVYRSPCLLDYYVCTIRSAAVTLSDDMYILASIGSTRRTYYRSKETRSSSSFVVC